jgi:hypothetical protein
MNARTDIPLKPMVLAAGICALLILPAVWNYRHVVSGDGLSYIEVASNAARSGLWPLFSNAYWSPSYPAILAIAMKVVHPSPTSELTLVRCLDWLTYVFVCATFTFFLRNLLARFPQRHFLAFVALAYTLLFVGNLDVSLWLVGPHILVEGMVYLAAGVCLRLGWSNATLVHHALLGVILALAYVTKAAMFPLSLALLGILFVRPPSKNMGRKGVAVATGAFSLGALPLVATLSYAKGRMTFGDVGRLAYARFVNDLPYFWEGPLPAAVTLKHPPKTVSSSPVILKFAGPFQATWPLWYDPSYWYEGIPTHFDVRQQVKTLLRSLGVNRGPNADDLSDAALRSLPLIAGLVALPFLGLRVRTVYAVAGEQIWLLVWPAFALFTFACVLVHYRYILPFAIVGWTALFAIALLVTKARSTQQITLGVAAVLLLMSAPGYAREVIHSVLDSTVPSRRERAQATDPAMVAAKLQALGIRAGDELASVEFPYRSGYLVRLTGASISLMIVAPPAKLSGLPADKVTQILAALRDNGAKALISYTGPAFDNDSGWVQVRDDIYVRPLR